MSPTNEQVSGTLAEAMGMTAEMGRAIAALAGGEVAGGRLDAAHQILEGLAVANPKDPVAWALLATVYRRKGEAEAARVCAEVAARLAPDDAQIRLVRAEAQLAGEAERDEARGELRALSDRSGPVGDRARALLAAMGE